MSDDRTYSLRAYPLAWPDGWKRTSPHKKAHGQFKTNGIRVGNEKATRRVLEELQRMGIKADDVLISTNLKLNLSGFPRGDQGTGDGGVAVYWRKNETAPMKVIATDRYHRVADNLAALAATLEAMRAIERHGGAEILERTFQGFSALPAQGSFTWRAVLGFSANETPSIELVEARFREYAKQHHPDTGGTAEKFHELTTARDAARQELGR